ncbi:MAG TPA: hypothetical protein DCY35_09590 [Prolixibacteraceae bacterium]|nr:hypothetical protein [Prolixibacteraceae bacterium]
MAQLNTIFESRNPTFIQSIVANLNTFGRSIEREQENQELRNKIKPLEERIAALKSGIQREGTAAAEHDTSTKSDLSTEKKAG